MRKLLLSILLVIMTATISLARQVEVSFQYPIDKENLITEFKLYRDTDILVKEGLAPNLRLFTVPAEADTIDHTYYVVAVGPYSTSLKSTGFLLKWVAPLIPKPTYIKARYID